MFEVETKNAFIELGKFLSQFSINIQDKKVLYNEPYYNKFLDLIALSQFHNGWYTQENVLYAIDSWAKALTEKNLNQWLSKYELLNNQKEKENSKTVGIILAGNIPLVGFHDFLSVLIVGHNVLIKTSSKDQKLLPFLTDYLIKVEPKMAKKIIFADGILDNFDAIIATGSNNTARYFEYYFRNKPLIIRKNRNSIAVLDGKESKEQMIDLGEDILRYFGLGCRNVSKLFVPRNYNFDLFFNGIYLYKDIINYKKYANNYDYNKAVFLMSNFKILDNEFLLIKEDSSNSSPIGCVFYEFYDDLNEIEIKLNSDKDCYQCIVSNNLIKNSISFGQTQSPKLWDYADNIDTIKFLIGL